MNILITSAGQRVSLVRAFKKEARELLPGSKVFTVDMRPELSPACQVSDGYFVVKPVTNESYIDDLVELCKLNQISLVIPTIDTELQILAFNKRRFEEEGIHVIVSNLTFVKACRDKRETMIFFQERGIDTPRLIDKSTPTFPLFIKPFDGSLSADNFIINSAKDLTDYHFENQRLIFMEYIDKKFNDEFTVDMYYGKDNLVKCIVPRKRIFVRAGEINKGVTIKNKLVSFLKERMNHIPGAIGCLTMQLFLNKENGSINAIEINPRFGGGYPLSYNAGANFPKWLIDEYFYKKQMEYTDNWEENLLMLRYDNEILVHDYHCS